MMRKYHVRFGKGGCCCNRQRSLVHSYMLPEDQLELGQQRLLDVDNKVIVPVDTHIRLIVTGKSSALIILFNII